MVPFFYLPFTVIYILLMLYIPDTPQFLLQNGKDEKALKALKFYRNCNEKDSQNVEKVRKELESLEKNLLNIGKKEVKLTDFSEFLINLIPQLD